MLHVVLPDFLTKANIDPAAHTLVLYCSVEACSIEIGFWQKNGYRSAPGRLSYIKCIIYGVYY